MQQINLHDKRYLEFTKYLGWILLFVFLWLRGCSDSPCIAEAKTIKIPEVKGVFEHKKPEHKPLVQNHSTEPKIKYRTPEEKSFVKSQDSLISELLSENEQLSRNFYFANDSLRKMMFGKAIKLNFFSKTFEDKNVKIDFYGIARGEVQSIQPFYTVKETEIDVPVPVTKFRLLAGGGLGVNKDLNQGLYKVNFGFQNPKGNILNAGYMKLNGQDYGVVEYYISIFKIDR